MKAMLSIDHPAWAHQFRNIVRMLNERGDEVLTLAVEKDGDTELLDKFGIPYVLSAHSTGKNIVEKGLLFLGLCIEHTWRALRFQPPIQADPKRSLKQWCCPEAEPSFPRLRYSGTGCQFLCAQQYLQARFCRLPHILRAKHNRFPSRYFSAKIQTYNMFHHRLKAAFANHQKRCGHSNHRH